MTVPPKEASRALGQGQEEEARLQVIPCFLAANLRRICKTIAEAPGDDERLKAFAPIQEMMTYVQFANDECDYGMGLELGTDLFCHGSHVSETPPPPPLCFTQVVCPEPLHCH